MQLPPGFRDYNFKRITTISICALLFGIIFGYFLFPILLKKLITSVSFPKIPIFYAYKKYKSTNLFMIFSKLI